jgi:hypothetical protein
MVYLRRLRNLCVRNWIGDEDTGNILYLTKCHGRPPILLDKQHVPN